MNWTGRRIDARFENQRKQREGTRMRLYQCREEGPGYATFHYYLMENTDGIRFMVEDQRNEEIAQDVCALWMERETGKQCARDTWEAVRRYKPSEGRRVARARGIPLLYLPFHPYELKVATRRANLEAVRPIKG